MTGVNKNTKKYASVNGTSTKANILAVAAGTMSIQAYLAMAKATAAGTACTMPYDNLVRKHLTPTQLSGSCRQCRGGGDAHAKRHGGADRNDDETIVLAPDDLAPAQAVA